MDTAAITKHYRAARKRLFLLDYDGTLAPLAQVPEAAIPSAALLALLQKLAADTHNTIVLVSGRDRQTLDIWLGGIPLSFAAEHGFLRKTPNTPWTPATPIRSEWRTEVHDRLQTAVAAVPGSFIEEKDTSLCWHYRTATNAAQAELAVEALHSDLPALCAHYQLRTLFGSMVVEVQPAGMDKGKAAQFWLQQPGWDFVLAAGDDTTDEDLFAACSSQAFTVKIGDGATGACMRTESSESFVSMLNQLTTAV